MKVVFKEERKYIFHLKDGAPRKSCIFCSEYNEVIGNIIDNGENIKEKISE